MAAVLCGATALLFLLPSVQAGMDLALPVVVALHGVNTGGTVLDGFQSVGRDHPALACHSNFLEYTSPCEFLVYCYVFFVPPFFVKEFPHFSRLISAKIS